MIVTDPIADLLTRIRNALTAKHETVTVPASKMKKAIADILVQEGYVKSAELIDADGHPNILIALKYGPKNRRVITNLKRISKPGLRVYCGSEKLPKVLGGLGIAIISTSKGVMTDKLARANNIGGEVLAYVW
ncbi:MAG: 30S ribosomal protein S8 [Clostridiales bacterium]|jgi:small subunit ribosomal protein S8|nr:30S ribosomal protein S8 [Clostridiales bacterium]